MNPEMQFWRQAAREGLPWFRAFRQSTAVSALDFEFQDGLREEWEALRARIEPGDQIWPFQFNTRPYLGERRGYVVLRQGEPIGGIITQVS